MLIFILILPKYISIGSTNLLEIERDLLGWNYIGVAGNYLLFLIILKYRKKPLTYYGLHFGRWRENIIWYSIVTISLLILFRIIDILTYGSLQFQIPIFSTFIFQFFYLPFGEELFWRGYVQTEYGIWIASILFGSMHFLNILVTDISLTQALLWAVYATFLGFVMGLIRKKTDSVYATTFFHGMVNISNYFFIQS